MIKDKKKMVYFSGPPCSGKSTICKELTKKIRNVKYVLGDKYWIKNDDYDFNRRIVKTNEDIIKSLWNKTSKSLLLEWVPYSGSFVSELKKICEEQKLEFNHVVIYAPKDILEQRKLIRDKNKELGPINFEEIKNLENVLLFDSSIEPLESIVLECKKLFD